MRSLSGLLDCWVFTFGVNRETRLETYHKSMEFKEELFQEIEKLLARDNPSFHDDSNAADH